ncbi:cytochrome b [Dankookia sp. P2]|uniref:cytochrome b n=1 Tax=Dankookia sp. P2 TaxID=3423955 RepID=UPI003D673C24
MTVMAEPVVPATASVASRAYTSPAKWFHWITAALVGIALPGGLLIQYFTAPDEAILKPDDAAAQAYLAAANAIKYGAYAIHESAGLTILLVMTLRLAWRLTHRPAPLPAHVPPVLRKAAAAVHHTLYALLVLQPILGFLATNAWGFPMQGATAYLGFIDLPKFMEPNTDLAGVLQTLHTIGGWSILVLLVLHVGGAIYHQAIRRDGTLLRMV